MYIENKGNLVYCKWNLFKPYKNIVAVFSTRKGGFSLEPYDSLNLGLTTGDTDNNVNRNRSVFFETLNISEADTAKMKQVHGDTVIVVGEPGYAGTGDGMISDTGNVFLCGTFADCASVIVFEPERRITGLFHAGWRGLVCEIVKKGIEKIIRTYSVNPCNLLAGISPHIKSCCFEVGEDVSSLFDGQFLTKSNGNKHYLNIEDVLVSQLCSAGMEKGNIERSVFCTGCNNELFFSHRLNKGKTGRMMAVAGIL